ncbi:serine protease [Nonomuraea longicatena]|uniref:Serine protease n=1 Tax=Nonomuraea longicatena TaxID=83682 RepID=A0ABP3ZCT6_9ACTN
MSRSAIVAVAGAACLAATAGSAGAIINGKDSSESYPFMASIPISAPIAGLEDGVCGAALIDPLWVVTAAHCLNMEVGSIPGGTVRIGSDQRKSGGEVRRFAQAFTHPKFVQSRTGGPNKNDIALIRLDRPVSAQPIKIAPRPGRPGTATRIIGFGTTVEGKPADWKMSLRLQELDTRRGAASECGPGYASSARLCTISKMPDAMACNGDSGSPQLQRGKGDEWELIGVTSGPGAAGVPCSDGPGLYVNVPAYADWISKTIRPAANPNG